MIDQKLHSLYFQAIILIVVLCLIFVNGCINKTSNSSELKACKSHQLDSAAQVLANGWNLDNESSRYQPANRAGITKDNVHRLGLSWAYVFNEEKERRGHPTVTEQAVLVSSKVGKVMALGKSTGCEIWAFKAAAQIRGGFLFAEGDDRGVSKANTDSAETSRAETSSDQRLIYFADLLANVYAIDAKDGKLVWQQKIEQHPSAKVTGSPKLFDGRLYIPVSSTEVTSAMSLSWICCTFRGSLVALDAKTGGLIWQTYTIAEEPSQQQGVEMRGPPSNEMMGPSGAPVWATPTIDVKRQQIIIGTGQNYSAPATETSDAIMALDLKTGVVKWVFQATKNDVWNLSCLSFGPFSGKNCLKKPGVDFDFGAAPVLFNHPSGKDLLFAAQKSGAVFALNPDDGKVIWRRQLGVGGNLGGTHWGIAVDKRHVYVPITDFTVNKVFIFKIKNRDKDSARLSDDARTGLTALDLLTGKTKWHIKTTRKTAQGEIVPVIFSAAITVSEEMVFAAGLDGLLRAFDSNNGELLWQFDTTKTVMGVNGIEGHGGTIDSGGPVLAGGMLYINSGYRTFGNNPKWYGGHGNVLLALGLSSN